MATTSLAEMRHVAADRDRRALLRSHLAVLGGSTMLSWVVVSTRSPSLDAFLAAPVAPLTIGGSFGILAAVIVAWLFVATMAALAKPSPVATTLATVAAICYAFYAFFVVLWLYVGCG